MLASASGDQSIIVWDVKFQMVGVNGNSHRGPLSRTMFPGPFDHVIGISDRVVDSANR